MTTSAPAVAIVFGILTFVAVAVLPGALWFRMPLLRRDTRAALPIEERWFWQLVLSLVWSVSVALALGAASRYSLGTLLVINGVVSAAILAAWRSRLLLRKTAARPTVSVLVPVVLIVFGLWRFLPAAEYIIGGKDPGVYVNEGISLHRTGTIFRRDAVIAKVPESTRELFFHDYPPTEYYGLRFMGVFLNDPQTGEVISQLPHLLPASIAIGYGMAGVRGATTTVVAWALLGLLAVYFFGVRIIGRLPAFAACILLGLNVIELWYARYTSAELVMQSFVFAGLLAFSYAARDENRFFGWVAGALAAVLIFLRFDAYLAIAAFAGAAALIWIVERRAIGWGAGLVVAAASVLAWAYYSGPMKAYFWQYRENLPAPMAGLLLVGAGIAATLLIGAARRVVGPPIRKWTPLALIALMFVLAIYALFFRHPAGRLAPWDAYALRTFRSAYVFWPAMIAGGFGFALLVWKRFWREPAFFLSLSAFSVFFFYKIRVQHEHFWMARRFLPLILPGLFLLAAAGAYGVLNDDERRRGWRFLAGSVLLALIGWQYAVAAAPVAAHVEYRGAIAQVEKLAARTGSRDLVIVEGRGASDAHVFALPLANVYGRDVLVLESEVPGRQKMEEFLRSSLPRYERILFVASGGTDLLTRRIIGTPIVFTPVILPEYATTDWDQYPSGPRQKDLSYSVYQLTLGEAERTGFVLDVGNFDELHVLRFHARETAEGRTFRWTGPQSFIAVTGLNGAERELTLMMHDGGRPVNAPPAAVQLFFNNAPLGTVRVEPGFREYRLALPPDLIRAASESNDPAQLRLVSTTWTPSDFLGGTDSRPLGVMIDRVEIH